MLNASDGQLMARAYVAPPPAVAPGPVKTTRLEHHLSTAVGLTADLTVRILNLAERLGLRFDEPETSPPAPPVIGHVPVAVQLEERLQGLHRVMDQIEDHA